MPGVLQTLLQRLLLLLFLSLFGVASRDPPPLFLSRHLQDTQGKLGDHQLPFLCLSEHRHQDPKNACFMDLRFSCFLERGANTGTTGSKQAGFRALSCDPCLAGVQRKILGEPGLCYPDASSPTSLTHCHPTSRSWFSTGLF